MKNSFQKMQTIKNTKIYITVDILTCQIELNTNGKSDKLGHELSIKSNFHIIWKSFEYILNWSTDNFHDNFICRSILCKKLFQGLSFKNLEKIFNVNLSYNIFSMENTKVDLPWALRNKHFSHETENLLFDKFSIYPQVYFR